MKLIKEYQSTFERFVRAIGWLEHSKYDTWEQVRDNKYKIYHEYENVINELEFLNEEMIKENIIPDWNKVAE